ncbi:hypothetical protein GX865_01985 [Candidatus Saccharibacteria bacterium]|jgi:predicted alpha/beta hydrolase family esterase|nr:hypothetical protein [Candidatus Saccharibacteria bacterium]
MKKAILVHGKPSRENYEDPSSHSASNAMWFPWLQKQLTLRDISTQTPEMLRSYQPDYRIWRETFEQFMIDKSTILLGHSCGAGFLVQWLSEHSDVEVGDVYLVGPAFGDRYNPETPYEDPLLGGFFDFKIDSSLIDRVDSLNILYSDNDSVRVETAVSMLKDALPGANYHLFKGYGHFRGKLDMDSDTFPELLAMIDSRLESS